MAISDRSLRGDNPRLKIDLEELFDGKVPKSSKLRQAVGQDILDRINQRTIEKNIDKDGKKFRGYTESYKDSVEFRAFGKSANDVDLTLTGDMLGLMDIVKADDKSVEIGWAAKDEAAKAHGHITGKRGQVPKMKRDFFGLPKKELNQVKRKFEKQVKRLRDQVEQATDEDRRIEFLRALIARQLRGENGEG